MMLVQERVREKRENELGSRPSRDDEKSSSVTGSFDLLLVVVFVLFQNERYHQRWVVELLVLNCFQTLLDMDRFSG